MIQTLHFPFPEPPEGPASQKRRICHSGIVIPRYAIPVLSFRVCHSDEGGISITWFDGMSLNAGKRCFLRQHDRGALIPGFVIPRFAIPVLSFRRRRNLNNVA